MVSIELPTNEQLEQKFNELSHTDEIEKERAWFWAGIAAYAQLQSPGSDEWKKQHGFNTED